MWNDLLLSFSYRHCLTQRSCFDNVRKPSEMNHLASTGSSPALTMEMTLPVAPSEWCSGIYWPKVYYQSKHRRFDHQKICLQFNTGAKNYRALCFKVCSPSHCLNPQLWVKGSTASYSAPWRLWAGPAGNTSSWKRSSPTDLTSCACRKSITTTTPSSQSWRAWVTAAIFALNHGRPVWTWRATTAPTGVHSSTIGRGSRFWTVWAYGSQPWGFQPIRWVEFEFLERLFLQFWEVRTPQTQIYYNN